MWICFRVCLIFVAIAVCLWGGRVCAGGGGARKRRSLLNLAKANKLTESFLWIPSLEGPTFDSPSTETLNWIKQWTGEKSVCV